MAISDEAKGIAFGSMIILVCVGVLLGVNLRRPPSVSPPAKPTRPPERAGIPRSAGKADPDAPQELVETGSGLKYRILRKSQGPKPKATDSATVNYHGWLDDGTVFDSSYNRGEPFTFGLTQVIPGWTEGMQLLGEGGMIELEIPAKLAYGADGAGNSVPPNATLHFVIELIKVK